MWFFKNYGILGQNARNLNFISEYNDDLAKSLADSKIKTKEFLSNKGVKVQENLAVIKSHKELDDFDLNSLPLPFVVKPNAGYGGKGIIVFEEKDEDGNFISNDNQTYCVNQLQKHISDILDGFYSLSGSRDKAIFERKIILDHSIELLGKYGLPDIRVIVFNSVPVIAMLRVPTANSKGKANLHMGACGLGIDIGSGKITYITQFRKMIKSVPGIGDVRGVEIPHWEDILKLAVKVQQVTNVGYVGCDIVLDDTFGPLLLEMNVRPGLEVQVANKIPLLERLKKVQNIKINSVEKGVRLARDLFGGDIEEKIKNISGKKVLGNKEYIEVYPPESPLAKGGPEGGLKIIGEIKTTKSNNYIDKNFLLNILKVPENKIKNDIIKLKCNILGEARNIRFQVKGLTEVNLIVGKEALYGFLVDPFKYKDSDLPIDLKNPLLREKNIVILKSYEDQLLRLDKEIMDIDKKLNILKIITPKNISSERLKFISSGGEYIPQLEYNELEINIQELFKKISDLEIPDIPLSGIFKRKKDDIINKLCFLKAFIQQDVESLGKYSKLLYGDIIGQNLEYAKDHLKNKNQIILETRFLTFDEIKKEVEKFNQIYGINVELKEKNIVSRFLMNGNKLYIKPESLVGKKEIRAIIAHEIEGHYFRKINGEKSKYSIFSRGTGNYSVIEEGIASYNQNKFLTKRDLKYYYNLERYYFIDFALNNNYKKLLEEYKKYYNNDLDLIFKYLVRLKRGLVNIGNNYSFTKDVIYLNGHLEIKEFLKNGGDLRELYFGKISILDLEEIKKSEFLDLKVDDLKIPLFV